MKAASIPAILRALARVHVLHKPTPLMALWNVTFRCNLRCLYCDARTVSAAELSTEEVKSGLDTLWKAGVRWITFGGGEPLIRDDIVELLRYARCKGMSVYLSTNGLLLNEKADALSYLDFVNVSLDGGQDVHEGIRGGNSFEPALQAARVCREHGVPVSFLCVLSSRNVERFDESLAIAEAEGVPIGYQPATLFLNSSTKPNPLAPPPEAYRNAIDALIQRKRAGAPIRNSFQGLRHLARWPNPTPIWCSAGVVSLVIEADGEVVPCHHYNIREFLENRGRSLSNGVESLHCARQIGCTACWCATLVELNLILSLHLEPIWNGWRCARPKSLRS